MLDAIQRRQVIDVHLQRSTSDNSKQRDSNNATQSYFQPLQVGDVFEAAQRQQSIVPQLHNSLSHMRHSTSTSACVIHCNSH